MNENFLNNDIELLLRVQQNDEKALVCLMQKYYNSLYRFALQFTKDEEHIKGCIRNVFVNLWEGRCFANNIVSLQSFLFRNIRGKLRQCSTQQTDTVYSNVNLYAY
jgi:hypothetical protein